MIRALLIFFISLFLYSLANSQEMNEGFALLESSNYHEANIYFTDILKKYPNNKTARICQARAMGLSDSKEIALQNLIKLQDEYPSDYEVGLNVAEAFMWNKDFESALVKYKRLLLKDPNNFVANLGLANANAGLNKNAKALEIINRSLDIKPNDPSALNSKKYILIALAYVNAKKRNHKPAYKYLDSVDIIESNQPNAIEIRALMKDHRATRGSVSYYSASDNAQNTAKGLRLYQSISVHPKNRLSIEAHFRTTDNTLFPYEANQNLYFLKNKTFLTENIEFEFGGGLTQNKTIHQINLNAVSFAQLSSKLNASNYVSAAYYSNYLQYNTALIKSNIKVDNYQLTHHLFTKPKIGFYNSLMHGKMTDGNSSNRLFSSLYYQWKNRPLLKFGANYSYIHFKVNNPELYFSPDKYQALEGFVHFQNMDGTRWVYKALVAVGFQQIENNKRQQIARVELLVGYKFAKELSLHLTYNYTNSAQLNTIGTYQFSQFGIVLNTQF